MDEEPILPFSLHLTARLADLERIRRFVETTATRLGLPEADVPMLVLAVDEAVSNVLVHGYRGEGGPLELDMGQSAGRLLVRLCDKAPRFDPTQVAPPDLTMPLFDRLPGGLGIHLIRKIADEMVYRPRPEGGNELLIAKRLPAGESGQSS